MNVGTGAIVLAAGGTGGHIFPALSVALELQRRLPATPLLWIGTSRSREKELCDANGIPIMLLDVEGIRRSLSLGAVRAALRFCAALARMASLFGKARPRAVVAFGGYVCAPVLAAAGMRKVPYFIQEQNTVPGLVNRLFSRGASRAFLGLPLAGGRRLSCPCEVTGNPVRPRAASYAGFAYPEGFSKATTTILVCGGSQGAQSMNEALTAVVKKWAAAGLQVMWQTGTASYDFIRKQFAENGNVWIFPTVSDLYPYYAAATAVVGRAGASTLAEASLFGLPAVVLPLPWAAENHQWFNAGLAQEQGWVFRVAQDADAAVNVEKAVEKILTDKDTRDAMRAKALEHGPAGAAAKIAGRIAEDMRP